MSGTAAKDESLWIAQACAGSQQAFRLLMERHHEGVLRLLQKRLGSAADAEDVAQQAFAKAFENIRSYSPKFAFSTWLYTIAGNCCIDFVRRHKLRSTVAIDKLVEDEINAQNAQPNPEESMIAEQEMATTSQLLERLKPQYKKVVELRYLKEYAYDAIAEELQMPIGTVKTMLFRAKEQLVKMIVKPR